MKTASPAFITFPVVSNGLVNSLDFELEFLAVDESEGLLSVYWGDVLLGTIDERYQRGVKRRCIFDLPGVYNQGSYSLSVRLDPFTDVSSEAVIGDVHLRYETSFSGGLSYDNWSTQYLSLGIKSGDSDRDGLTNLTEYLMDSDPVIFNSFVDVGMQAVAFGETGIALEYSLDQSRTDGIVLPEWSHDFKEWMPMSVDVKSVNNSKITLSGTAEIGHSGFVRIRALANGSDNQ